MKLETLEDQIEALVDRHTVGELMYALSRVCSAKADHLRSNWQDDVSGGEWDRVAEVVCNCARKAGVL